MEPRTIRLISLAKAMYAMPSQRDERYTSLPRRFSRLRQRISAKRRRFLQEFKVFWSWNVVYTACLLAGLCSFSLGESNEAPSAAAVNGTLKYGIVVDNSGSMRLQLESVIGLVKGIVGENQPGDETFLVRFASSDKIVLLEELTSVKATIQDTADEMFI